MAASLASHGIGWLEIATPSLQPVPLVGGNLEFTVKVRQAQAVAFTSRYAIRALARLGALDGLFIDTTSSNALSGDPLIAVVGERTARELQKHGVAPNLVAEPSTGQGLAAALCAILPPGATVICPQAAHARPELVDGLRRSGLVAVPCVCYENRAPDTPSTELLASASGADLVYFAAPSAADRLYGWAPSLSSKPWVAIGPTTARAVTARHGNEPTAVAQTPLAEDVVDAIVAAIGALSSSGAST